MRRRLWLLAPAAALFTADVGLTLAGQRAAYWAGDYAAAHEANPVAYPLLARSPWLFLAAAAGWLAVHSAVVIGWRHPAAGWVAVAVAFAHAIGGSSWLTRIEPMGFAAAAAYLVAAAQISTWCWRRSVAGQRVDRMRGVPRSKAMTAAAAEAPVAAPPTPVEWVKSLPVEDREAVFIELLREVIAINGNVGRIDIETQGDEYLGFFVTAEAERLEAQRVLPKVSEEWMAELRARQSRLHEAVPIRELIGKPIGEVLPSGSE